MSLSYMWPKATGHVCHWLREKTPAWSEGAAAVQPDPQLTCGTCGQKVHLFRDLKILVAEVISNKIFKFQIFKKHYAIQY